MNRHAHRYRLGAALLISLLVASNGFGWGQEGHVLVATIAEANLTAQARLKVHEILGPDATLASVSTWADDIRPARPETASWHYIDIPLHATEIDEARDCPNGDCVTAAITRYVAVLRDISSTADAKNEALKFVDHFVADVHQPLHCADDNDKGGNLRILNFFGQPSNLHAVWDVLLIERIEMDTARYAARLNATITGADIAAWDRGSVNDWALECHAVAQKLAYGALPPGQNPELGVAYFKAAEYPLELQLKRAGIRLAYILNQTFR